LDRNREATGPEGGGKLKYLQIKEQAFQIAAQLNYGEENNLKILEMARKMILSDFSEATETVIRLVTATG
jgi:hypothetical protein